MLKIKLKRNFKFEKIRRNLKITHGTNIFNDVYSYGCVTDSSIIRFARITAKKYNAEILNYTSEQSIAADYGCITIYSTKTDFIAIVNEILEYFNEYISHCQF